MEHNSRILGNIHKEDNHKKYFCHFTGFLEGIAASGNVELGEVAPLLEECKEFVRIASDFDAQDIIEDFEAELLEYENIETVAAIRLQEIDQNCSKSLVNRFLGFCRGIVCDGVVTTSEAKAMINYLLEYPSCLEIPGVREIQRTCLDAIADGIVDSEESFSICDSIGEIVGDCYADTGLAQTTGVANFIETAIGDISAELDGAVVVLTGTFKTSPRRILEDRLSEFGAIIAKSPTRKTKFLIVGGEASRDWLEMNRGGKIIKAIELRKNSKHPGFVSELQLMRLLG